MQPNDICNVTNRSTSSVIYRIDERHIRRVFAPRETKQVPFYEITEVCAQPGGRELFHDYLLIREKDAIKQATNIKEEVEYFMTEDQIKAWMPTCSLPEFQDALDFAPQGVKDLIKKWAVDLPLNDVAKREALKTQLGFNVDKAVEVDRESKKDEPTTQKPNGRRVQSAAGGSTGRRIVLPEDDNT